MKCDKASFIILCTRRKWARLGQTEEEIRNLRSCCGAGEGARCPHVPQGSPQIPQYGSTEGAECKWRDLAFHFFNKELAYSCLCAHVSPLYINIIFLFLFIFSQRIPVKSSCSSWGRLLVFVNSAISFPGRDSLLSRAAAALKVASTCVASDLCALAWKNLNWSQFCHCFPLQLRAGCASPLFIASLIYGVEIIGLGGTRPEVSRGFDTTKSRCSDAIQFPSFLS